MTLLEELLALYRNMSEQEQQELISLARQLVEEQEANKKN